MKSRAKKRAKARRGKIARKVRCPACGGWCRPRPLPPPPATVNSPEPFIEMLKVVIAERLRASTLTDYKLAQGATLHRQTIGDMKKGRHSPDIKSTVCLCRFWLRTMTDIMAETERRCRREARGKASDSSD